MSLARHVDTICMLRNESRSAHACQILRILFISGWISTVLYNPSTNTGHLSIGLEESQGGGVARYFTTRAEKSGFLYGLDFVAQGKHPF
jgi:hypothetical protein